MTNQPLQIKKIAAIATIGLAILISVSIIIKIITANNQKVIIQNLTSCSENISAPAKNLLFTQLYPYINQQNQLSNTPTASTYYATFRDNSCQTTEFKDQAGASYQTTAIIDLESLKYSYKITYYWTKSTNAPKDVDLASVSLYCLTDKELIYGPFDCQSLPGIQIESDPILSILPYFGDGFTVTPTLSTTSNSGYGINILYNPSTSIYLSGETEKFQTEADDNIINYLTSHGIIIEDYTLTRRYAIVK